jgi:hypothetical protein
MILYYMRAISHREIFKLKSRENLGENCGSEMPFLALSAAELKSFDKHTANIAVN